MFDIGFWELALIAVVALLVVGPERLPAFARALGVWVGRLRRFVSQVRDDVERELRAEELKNAIGKPEQLDDVRKAVSETRSSLDGLRKDLEAHSEPASGKSAAGAGETTPGGAEPAPPSSAGEGPPPADPGPADSSTDADDDRPGQR